MASPEKKEHETNLRKVKATLGYVQVRLQGWPATKDPDEGDTDDDDFPIAVQDQYMTIQDAFSVIHEEPTMRRKLAAAEGRTSFSVHCKVGGASEIRIKRGNKVSESTKLTSIAGFEEGGAMLAIRGPSYQAHQQQPEESPSKRART